MLIIHGVTLCWEETRKWHGAIIVGQQVELRKKLTYFDIAKGSDPVEKYMEIEDVCEGLRDAVIDVDDGILWYLCRCPSFRVRPRNPTVGPDIGF